MMNKTWLIGGSFCMMFIALLIISAEPIVRVETELGTSHVDTITENDDEVSFKVTEPIAMEDYYYTSLDENYIQVHGENTLSSSKLT